MKTTQMNNHIWLAAGLVNCFTVDAESNCEAIGAAIDNLTYRWTYKSDVRALKTLISIVSLLAQTPFEDKEGLFEPLQSICRDASQLDSQSVDLIVTSVFRALRKSVFDMRK